jgi:hypothetical protein
MNSNLQINLKEVSKILASGSEELQKILKKALNSTIILDFSKTSLFADFSCQKGCQECCGYAYFLPAELSQIKKEVRSNLSKSDDGMYEITKSNGRCIFYDPIKELFCRIYDHRPLRCRIYPYFPVIVDERIIITMEPALRMKNLSINRKHCPGIGKKAKQLKHTIDDCISFLKHLKDTPKLLETVILTGERFNNIRDDRWFLELYE